MGDRLWCPSRYESVNFNICRVANEDEVGCGGVLRDADGVVRALFSSPLVEKDSITAETGAIIIALDMYLALGWNGIGSLIIEISSKEVFGWFGNKRMRSWRLHTIFIDIENRMERVGIVSFSLVEKQGNGIVSALAFTGVKGLIRLRHGGDLILV